MLSSSRALALTCCFCAFFAFLGTSCKIEPLNKRLGSAELTQTGDSEIEEVLASLTIAPVDTRIAQQVRNELVFALKGGRKADAGLYRVEMDVSSQQQDHSILTGVRGPTAARIVVSVNYRLVEKSGGKVAGSGTRTAFAGYDLTPQNFANRRARLDAENRAAKSAARLIRLALAQTLVNL